MDWWYGSAAAYGARQKTRIWASSNCTVIMVVWSFVYFTNNCDVSISLASLPDYRGLLRFNSWIALSYFRLLLLFQLHVVLWARIVMASINQSVLASGPAAASCIFLHVSWHQVDKAVHVSETISRIDLFLGHQKDYLLRQLHYATIYIPWPSFQLRFLGRVRHFLVRIQIWLEFAGHSQPLHYHLDDLALHCSFRLGKQLLHVVFANPNRIFPLVAEQNAY